MKKHRFSAFVGDLFSASSSPCGFFFLFFYSRLMERACDDAFFLSSVSSRILFLDALFNVIFSVYFSNGCLLIVLLMNFDSGRLHLFYALIKLFYVCLSNRLNVT